LVEKGVNVKYIKIEVRCIGCGELTTPRTVDWELFRVGVHVHSDPDCIRSAEAMLTERAEAVS